MTDRIKIQGLREFQKALRKVDADLPKQLKLIFGDATDIVIDYATPRVPSRTGKARASIKKRLNAREARVAVGGNRAPYFPWLDFGGEGRVAGRPAARRFIKEGRYLYPALRVRHDDILTVMQTGMDELARAAGLDVD